MSKVRTNFKPERPRHFIKEWRKFRGHTQEELAEIVGVTHSALGQLERGVVNYTQPMLEALASALYCAPADLVSRNPEDQGSLWKLHENLRGASPDIVRRANDIIEALLKAG